MATTVARTLIVVATLAVLAVGFVVFYWLPRERARDEWTRCAKPHIEAAERARYDLKELEAAVNAMQACGPQPP